MVKKVGMWSAVILFTASLALAGCGKKEEPAKTAPAPAAPAAPAGGAPGEPGAMAPAPAGGAAPAAPGAPAESKPEEKKAEGAKTK